MESASVSISRASAPPYAIVEAGIDSDFIKVNKITVVNPE